MQEIQEVTEYLESMAAAGVFRKYTTDRGGVEYRSNRTIEPLLDYLHRGLITRKQFSAGTKLKRVFDSSRHNHKPVQSRYEPYCPASPGGFESKFELSRAYVYALACIRGDNPRTTAIKVICYGDRAGKGNLVYLQSALDDLADHFMI